MRYWLLRYHDALLISDDDFPHGPATAFGDPAAPLAVGTWQGSVCDAADLETPLELEGTRWVPLRKIHGLLGPAAFALAGRAVQLLDWQRNHRFCGHCGTTTQRRPQELAMVCPACGLLAYPRLAPAVMVLIRRGNQLLLARGAHFPPGMYSALAGFVEPGETLEQCAVREVREEVGLEISHLRYFHSQPWPFPHSLMVAFFADYAGGELRLDPSEIEAADWFDLNNLPRLPDTISIARHLIEAACAA